MHCVVKLDPKFNEVEEIYKQEKEPDQIYLVIATGKNMNRQVW
jgi:hypothetical protein